MPPPITSASTLRDQIFQTGRSWIGDLAPADMDRDHGASSAPPSACGASCGRPSRVRPCMVRPAYGRPHVAEALGGKRCGRAGMRPPTKASLTQMSPESLGPVAPRQRPDSFSFLASSMGKRVFARQCECRRPSSTATARSAGLGPTQSSAESDGLVDLDLRKRSPRPGCSDSLGSRPLGRPNTNARGRITLPPLPEISRIVRPRTRSSLGGVGCTRPFPWEMH